MNCSILVLKWLNNGRLFYSENAFAALHFDTKKLLPLLFDCEMSHITQEPQTQKLWCHSPAMHCLQCAAVLIEASINLKCGVC